MKNNYTSNFVVGMTISVFVLAVILGAWIGRTDIIISCDHTGTFTHIGVTYNCNQQEIEE